MRRPRHQAYISCSSGCRRLVAAPSRDHYMVDVVSQNSGSGSRPEGLAGMLADTGQTSRTSLSEFGDQDYSRFASGVSLHAHTLYSRETLDDLPRYLAQIPLVGRVLERELRACADRAGSGLDFSKAWWRPPMTPRAVFESEVAQIEDRFSLSALVSVSDHDNIAAGLDLQQ